MKQELDKTNFKKEVWERKGYWYARVISDYEDEGGQVLPFNPAGWFETAAGESLTCTTSAGSTAEISGVYIEV